MLIYSSGLTGVTVSTRRDLHLDKSYSHRLYQIAKDHLSLFGQLTTSLDLSLHKTPPCFRGQIYTRPRHSHTWTVIKGILGIWSYEIINPQDFKQRVYMGSPTCQFQLSVSGLPPDLDSEALLLLEQPKYIKHDFWHDSGPTRRPHMGSLGCEPAAHLVLANSY